MDKTEAHFDDWWTTFGAYDIDARILAWRAYSAGYHLGMQNHEKIRLSYLRRLQRLEHDKSSQISGDQLNGDDTQDDR